MRSATQPVLLFVPSSPPVSELPPTACADPLQALRTATAAQHAQLDAQLAISRPDASLADYVAHVHALAAWLQALWPHLQMLQATTPGFDFTPPQRLAALQADLREQPLTAGGPAISWPLPGDGTLRLAAQALAAHPGQLHAVCWGFAYVVEGSQLGGQVLYRQLAQRLAPHPLRYLHGDGASTGARWKLFIALLRQHIAPPPAVEAACHGARAAFAALQSHFLEPEGMQE